MLSLLRYSVLIFLRHDELSLGVPQMDKYDDDGEINPEDVVRLNSGGPDMTVTGIGSEDGVRSVWCCWFAGTKMEKGVFPLSSLKRARQKS
jgi:uncharacterized protein YodC (DUF2158 family)